MTEEDEQKFNNTNICWMCDRPFGLSSTESACENQIKSNESKVRDHDHFNGEYRGAAHDKCNINCKKPRRIPIIFHNGSNYDNHLFIKALAEYGKNKKINIIGKTTEEYLSVRYGCLNFIDSLRFFDMSLDSVGNSLQDEDFKIFKKYFMEKFVSNYSAEEWKLCRSKGIFPYDFIDSFDKFNQTHLPPKDDFYSVLYNSNIKDDEHTRAQKMWNLLKCKDLGEYNDKYLLMDVYILADCFESFISKFKLNPCNYVSAPSLSWDVLLSKSKIELDLLTDLEMFLMIKNNIRGGISSIMGKRKVEAHNYKTLEAKINNLKTRNGKPILDPNEIKEFEDFLTKSLNDPDWLLYLDASALYSGIMTQYMPYKNFKWEYQTQEFEDFQSHQSKEGQTESLCLLLEKILATPKDSEVGYFIEVDLEYPDSIKNETRYFPLAPVKRKIEYEELLDWQKKTKTNKNQSAAKLVCDTGDRKEYLCHYQNLQFYLKIGMKIKKVHSIISFNQKPWMSSFIKDNIKNRIEAKDKGLVFLVAIFKLLNNSVFGKTMENLDKRRDINLYTSKEMGKIQKIISKPTFQGEKKFSDHLIAIETGNYEKLYNKPIYIGFTILELSKLQMYKFYYEDLLPHFKDRISAHAQDTDSLFLLIKSPNIYKEIETHFKDLINPSGELFTYKDENVEEIKDKNGKIMKDENGKTLYSADVMTKFIIIRAKQYAYETIKNKTAKKLKGIQKSVVKNTITIKNYEDCIDDVEPIQFETVHAINSIKHDVYLKEQKKQ